MRAVCTGIAKSVERYRGCWILRGCPNLERQIAESPAIFFQALALAFNRSEHGQDPPE